MLPMVLNKHVLTLLAAVGRTEQREKTFFTGKRREGNWEWEKKEETGTAAAAAVAAAACQ